nr:response regulator transcription factor [Aneurinibacillus sp. XH2]
MKEIRLLLVDDQDLIRESLHIVLDMDPEIEVVGLAENGRIAVDLCSSKQPNTVLMDIHMPEMDGVEATRQIKKQWPDIRVIILTTFQEIDYVVQALDAGAEGYLLKAIHPKELVSGIKWVHSGGTLIPQDIAKMLVKEIKNGESAEASRSSSATDSHGSHSAQLQPAPQELPKLSYGLSERELEVLQLISAGLNNREIAVKLFLSEGTVKNYISSIYSKMDVRDRMQAAKKANDEGIL